MSLVETRKREAKSSVGTFSLPLTHPHSFPSYFSVGAGHGFSHLLSGPRNKHQAVLWETLWDQGNLSLEKPEEREMGWKCELQILGGLRRRLPSLASAPDDISLVLRAHSSEGPGLGKGGRCRQEAGQVTFLVHVSGSPSVAGGCPPLFLSRVLGIKGQRVRRNLEDHFVHLLLSLYTCLNLFHFK